MPQDFMTRLRLDDHELQSRRAYFEIGDEDLARLAALHDFAERHSQEIVDGLYQLILEHPESRAFFADSSAVDRVKTFQHRYFLGLFEGRCDLAYVQDRLRVGCTHERIGLAPKWYMGAYSRYQRLLLDKLFDELPVEEARQAYRSVSKMVAFDKALAMDTYVAANLDTLARHQAAIRELSTPVIRMYHRVLLLPIVGTVDSHRAQQIMETLLSRAVEDQALAVIMDIQGVPVVDTRVADHLLKTTAALRLLGAETILTGISGEIAVTIVQLGVDMSTIHTRSRLADGIELALSMVGKVISTKKA